MSMNVDRHHLLWQRKKWRKHYARKLRSFWYLKVPIPKHTLHRYIHEQIEGIPTPNEALCESTLEQLRELDKRELLHDTDTIERRLNLLIVCLNTGNSSTAEALRRQLEVVERYNKKNPR